MQSKTLQKTNSQWEMGSQNVFSDLDMPDSNEKLVKAELAFKINQIFKSRHLNQSEAAKMLGTDQSKISLLARGRLSAFSIERLVRYLNLLNRDVEIVIKKKKNQNVCIMEKYVLFTPNKINAGYYLSSQFRNCR